MLCIIVSPRRLDVKEGDIQLLGIVKEGINQGTHVYANTRWLRDNSKNLFRGDSLNDVMKIFRSEIKSAEDLHHTLSVWFDSTMIFTLDSITANDFEAFYQFMRNPKLMQTLATLPIKDDPATNIADILFLNNLDYVVKVNKEY